MQVNMSKLANAAMLALLGSVVLLSAPPAVAQSAQRVFVVVADSVPLSVAAAATAVSESLTRDGWAVLANHSIGVDAARCGYSARVIVARQPAHTAALAAKGVIAAFAATVRIGVFEDERGVHISMVNPLSLDRTVIAETGREAAGRAIVDDVTKLVVAATNGQRANRQYGQSRDRGLIGKTMGVMAGGPFPGRIETIFTAPYATSADVRRTADQIWQRFQKPSTGKWQLRGVYRTEFDDQGTIILGVSGGAMEKKAFDIVGSGDDNSRSHYKCPGIAYAPAFPLELVVWRDGNLVKVDVIDAMFRMKMYFEDAGRMKFARNMGMPGSIADELKATVSGPPLP